MQGDFVMMDTIEFKSVLDEIIDILSSCESMINADSDECFVCRNDIKENENNATCESCDKHFHVSCIYKSDDKLADQRLIWICSCGNNNIAHRMFDRVCIPSHYNRYQPLDDMLQDEENFECPQPIINKQRNRQSGRSKKRYVKKQRNTNVFPEKQSANDTKTSECNRCEPDLVAKENSSKTKDAKVESEQFDHDWVTVKSKKTKLMDKTKARLHSHSKDDVTSRKHTRSINGVLLEPGVTYIGKAVKEYFGRRKSSHETKAKGKVDEKQYRDGNGKSPSFHVKCTKSCQSRHNNVQSYTECLLNEYAKSVQSPHSMESYSEKCKEINPKQSWADVARNSGSETRRDKSVNSDACTCHVFQQLKDDRQQLYADDSVRDSKSGRKKVHSVKSKKNVSKKEESQHTCSDEKSNSKVDQSDKNDANVNPQNKSQRTLITPEFDTCCICNHVIERNESKANCEYCRNHYHVTCAGFPCKLKTTGLKKDTSEFKTILDEILHIVSNCASMISSEYDTCVSNQIEENESNAATKVTMTWANVAGNSKSVTRGFESVKTDVTCHVLQHNRDDGRMTVQQLHGGGKSKCGRNKKGCFIKSNKKSSKKEELQHTDENSKVDQSDKNETDCKPNHANVNPQNKSQRNLISPEFETCCICNNEIEQNESKATCDSCKHHYHVTCKGFACKVKKLGENTIEFKTIPDKISDILSINVDQDFKIDNFVCDSDKDKSNEIIIDDHSDSHVPGEDVCARDSDSHRSDTYQYERNVSPMSFNICGKPKDCPVNQELDKTHESVCKNEDIIKDNDIDDEETVFESNKGTFGSIYTLNSDSLQRHSYTTIKTIAQGNFHQGDPKFGDTAGTQCACNALIAILYTQTKNGNEINAHDMDVILNLGDELYCFTQTDSTMHNVLLMISELPNELHILNESFSMEYAQPIYGVLEGSEENLSSFGAMSLSQALQHQLPKYDACFMNFDQSIFAIIKGCNGYFVFDSHSRSRDGYLKEDGHSVLLYISSCEGIQRHCLTLAQSMGRCLNKTQFELTGVNVQVNRPSSYVSSSAECDKSNYVKNGNSDKQKTLEIEKDLNENSDTDETDDGIIFISHDRCTERSDKYFKFVPLQTEDKKKLCFKLNINYCGTHSESLQNGNGNMYIGKPIHIKRSIGDGNCYYRTMAHAIGGTERNHLKLRKANVRHLLQNEDLFRCTLDTSTYNSVREHVFANRLMDSGTWSNDTEIFSFANMIGFDIYSYNDQTQCWQIFCAKKPGHYNQITTERGIYMLYTGGNHFDAVESVANVDLSTVEEEDLINVVETEVINVDSNSEADILLNENCSKKTVKTKRKLQIHKEDQVNFEPKCKQMKSSNDVDSACDVKAVKRKRKISAPMRRQLQRQEMKLKRCQEKINEGASKKSRKAKNADAMKKKYQNDLSYRFEHILNETEACKRNYNSTFESEYNEKLKNGEKIHNCNMTYRDKKKENTKRIAKDHYKNPSFRYNLKLDRKEQYHNDECLRQDKKEKMKQRRREMYTNAELREKMKERTRKCKKSRKR